MWTSLPICFTCLFVLSALVMLKVYRITSLTCMCVWLMTICPSVSSLVTESTVHIARSMSMLKQLTQCEKCSAVHVCLSCHVDQVVHQVEPSQTYVHCIENAWTVRLRDAACRTLVAPNATCNVCRHGACLLTCAANDVWLLLAVLPFVDEYSGRSHVFC
jgi:hypothetical protein